MYALQRYYKRLGFLHYILNEDQESMVNRFFHSQMKMRTKKDWVTTVLEDLKDLRLSDMSMEQLRKMKKSLFHEASEKQQ